MYKIQLTAKGRDSWGDLENVPDFVTEQDAEDWLPGKFDDLLLEHVEIRIVPV